MALQKQIIPVEFKTGLNDKLADQLMAGEFDALENCVRRKYGRIDKRTGYSALGTALVDSLSTITSGTKLDVYNESELLMFNGQNAYSYIGASDQWIARGSAATLSTTSDPVVRNNSVQFRQDSACNGDISAYIYQDTRGGVWASVYQDQTPIIIDQRLDTTGINARAIALGTYIYLMYRKSASLVVKRVSVVNPAVIETVSTALVNDMDTSGSAWDIDVYDPASSAVFIYPTGASATKIGYFLANGTIGTTASGYPNVVAVAQRSDAFNCVKCDPDRSRLWFVWFGQQAGAQAVRLYGLTSNFATVASATIETQEYGVDPYTFEVTSELNSDNNLEIIFSQEVTTNTYNNARRTVYSWAVGSSSFVQVSAPALLTNGVSLASQAFKAEDIVYVWVQAESRIQPTYFLVRTSDGVIVAREFAGTAGNGANDYAQQRNILPSVMVTNAGFSVSLQVVTRQALIEGTIQATWRNLISLQMDFVNGVFRGVNLGNVYHLQGAIPKIFDGQSFIEEGFNQYPEERGIAALTGGSITSNATYFVSAIYEWVDGQGNVIRSAPSILQPIAMGGTGTKINFRVTSLKITEKSARSPVKIVVYRGVANQDAVLYRDVVVTNDSTVDTQTISLIQSDSALSQNEILYTTGGVLENLSSPPATLVAVYKNRIVLAGLEDPNQLAYSKQYQPGEAVAFNDGLRLQVDPAGGDITALGALDDKLIIFKHGRILALTGDGPLDTGAQNDFTSPVLISTDVGCDNPESILITPDGLMFKSTKGIRLLDRNLGVQPVGEEVDDFKDLTITGAALLGTTEEIRFTTSDGAALVYNYRFKQWSTFTNYESRSSVRLINDFYHLSLNGLVMKDNVGYLDNGARYRMAIETSWLSFAGLQGYQRIYRLACLGDFISDHYTVLKLAYDFEESYKETIYFNVDDGLDLSYYGDGVYGESTYGGPGSGVYQFSTKPRQQKCESIKLRIEDIDTKTAAGGGSFNFVSMTFEVGTKGTIDKLSGSKRIGSL